MVIKTAIEYKNVLFERNNGVDQKLSQLSFKMHMCNEKHFAEPFLHTLKRYILSIAHCEPSSETPAQAKIRLTRLDDAISEAIERKYLQAITLSNTFDGFFIVTREGRRFVKPLVYIEVVLKEYSQLVTLLLGIGAGAAIPWLLQESSRWLF